MEAKQLATLIYARIKSDGGMSLTEIRERARDKGHGDMLVLDAISYLGRFKDIKVTVKDNTNYYSIRPQAAPKTALPSWQPSPEERTRMDEEVRDFWEQSPLVTTEERECYYQSLTDRDRWKTCECESCTHWRWMLSTREERAMAEVVRQREVVRSI